MASYQYVYSMHKLGKTSLPESSCPQLAAEIGWDFLQVDQLTARPVRGLVAVNVVGVNEEKEALVRAEFAEPCRRALNVLRETPRPIFIALETAGKAKPARHEATGGFAMRSKAGIP